MAIALYALEKEESMCSGFADQVSTLGRSAPTPTHPKAELGDQGTLAETLHLPAPASGLSGLTLPDLPTESQSICYAVTVQSAENAERQT